MGKNRDGSGSSLVVDRDLDDSIRFLIVAGTREEYFSYIHSKGVTARTHRYVYDIWDLRGHNSQNVTVIFTGTYYARQDYLQLKEYIRMSKYKHFNDIDE